MKKAEQNFKRSIKNYFETRNSEKRHERKIEEKIKKEKEK